ncbi:MAG: S8 family serine peptidase [Methylococcales symbiont of Iophon sp. n. MRB-2018]|nr:MAG: S8 family serine peptidase [Methylococcales symbiont of Iophon sp. n. MRB-2018]KAF3980283.1 MAG: S8 family serine peptidase [Methylococcales symbiont of Iophon sp. n. MRB-2018]
MYKLTQNRWNYLRCVLYCICTLSLFACGGGGGNKRGSTTPTPTSVEFPRTATDPTSFPPSLADFEAEKLRFESSPEYTVSYTAQPCAPIAPSICAPTGPSINSDDTHLERIKAAAAYARGATGEGETIVVVDSGIRLNHREFSGMDKATSIQDLSRTDADRAHGTLVSAVAAGNRDAGSGLNMHGVAFDAKLRVIELPLSSSDGIYNPFVLTDHDDQYFADLFDTYIMEAKNAEAAAMNLSFGVNGAISQYDEAEVRSRFILSAAALEQQDTDAADKTILVWAAGNAATQRTPGGAQAVFDSPELWPGLGVYFPELQPHVLAVVALDQDGGIADYSNHCGIAKSFCLAAPGSDIISADAGGIAGYAVASGTSFAAPMVSGSLALLRQYFDGQLGNTDLATRLLVTANREGIYADSDIYGHGLLDLDAATSPMGALMTGLPGDAGSRPLAGSSMAVSGTAFGGALEKALANVQITGFDALGAPFSQSMASWVTPVKLKTDSASYQQQKELKLAISPYQNNSATMSLGINSNGTINDTRLAFDNGWWMSYGYHGGKALGLYATPADNALHSNRVTGNAGFFKDPLLFAAPYLSLVSDGVGLGLSNANKRIGFTMMYGSPQFNNQYKPGGKRGLGAMLDFSLNNGLSLQAGAVHESDGFLGTRLQGVLGDAQGMTTFVGANGRWKLANKWQILTSAYFGHTRQQVANSSLLSDDGTILSSAFSLGAMGTSIWHESDLFGLRLSQPLRIEGGNMKLRIPVGRTKYGEVIYKNHKLNLKPTGRNMQAEIIYHRAFASGILKTSIGAEHNSQHSNKNGTDLFMQLFFERSF